jgi:RNA polymerase sigma-70 factor (ECF subfamily)
MSGRSLARGRAPLRVMSGDGGSPRPPVISDEELVEGVRRGDEAVAVQLYDHLFGVVDRTLYRVLGQRGPDHADLVQQAFEQVVITVSRHAFAHLCSLKTWAARVSTNVALNSLRSRRRERAVIDWTRDPDLEVGMSSGRDPTGAIESRVQLGRVRVLLSEMNAAQVEALLLHDVLGHDLGEIALMLRISVPAAQSRVFRGRRELRKRLEKAGILSSKEAP